MSFHIPMPGLFADLEAGTASVSLPEEFMRVDPLLKAEVIQQWLVELNVQMNAAIADLYANFKLSVPKSSPETQWKLFRQHCLVSGFDCPADLSFVQEAIPRER